MPDVDLDFNPFPLTPVVMTQDQKAQLFDQSQQGDQEALQILARSYSDMIEKIILQLQDKNIPEKYTFTYLFDDCMENLKDLILRFSGFQDFDDKVAWVIRQNILQKFA